MLDQSIKMQLVDALIHDKDLRKQLYQMIDRFNRYVDAVQFAWGYFHEADVVWNPASVASGASLTSSDISVPGALLGDAVVVYPPYDLQGLGYSGYVSAANTVKVVLVNLTGGAVDLASGTWKVRVLNRS